MTVGSSAWEAAWTDEDGPPVDIVGRVDRFDEVVPAMEEVRPSVVVLRAEDSAGAFRLASSPAAVVVVSPEAADPTYAAALNVAVVLASLHAEVVETIG
jgi:hypothetical protein